MVAEKSMIMESPIFIHSMFRSSSTYFFAKFRSLGAAVTCYKEPFHEDLLSLNDPRRWDELIAPPHETVEHLRHPLLEKAYFHEYWIARERLMGLFKKSFSYCQYFLENEDQLPHDAWAYLAALISCPTGRPVLHFCRSSGRIGAIRSAFGGMHIYMWREPRTQWWSYKITEYFDQANRRIFESKHLPRPLRAIQCQIEQLHKRKRYFPASANYMMFYSIWLDAWIRAQGDGVLSINVDAASHVQSENARLSQHLGAGIGVAIDLSDLRVSGMFFMPEENGFYEDIEAQVHAVFVQTGAASPQLIENVIWNARQARDLHRPEMTSQRNLRQLSLGMMDRISKLNRPLFQF